MWLYVFYLGDEKGANTDILKIDMGVMDRLRKDIEDGKPILKINPGESMYEEKKGKLTLITYTQYIVMSNVCKIIIDDMN